MQAIKGLVLAGGKSLRMGKDKGLIEWHGQPQRQFIAGLLQQFCSDVFISCRAEQIGEIIDYSPLPDTWPAKGPIAGIISAFEKYSDCAWLVVACDLPLLDASTLQFLLDNRDSTNIATTYKSPFDGLPEPLITIWEPAAYSVLVKWSQDGYSCPRKVLINSKTKILTPPNEQALLNANTPEDELRVLNIIHAGQQI